MTVETNCFVQSGDVQSPIPRSSVGSRGGIAVGSDSISGAFEKKEERRSWDKSSAQVFRVPKMCTATSSNWNQASMKNKQRRRCMRVGSQLDLLAIVCTAAWLSHRHLTREPCHLLPHTAHASSTAKSSKKEICADWLLAATETGTSWLGSTPHTPFGQKHHM